MFGASIVRAKRERERKERLARGEDPPIIPYIKPFGPRFDASQLPYFKYRQAVATLGQPLAPSCQQRVVRTPVTEEERLNVLIYVGVGMVFVGLAITFVGSCSARCRGVWMRDSYETLRRQRLGKM